ncbi:hypothetical protein [Consotaella aegiceratis]|uniref:hypothetical protein n=1 Tax=Consotaella aegiceratis TaxID=3097961 RepID=UPI002F42B3B1
MGFRIGALLIAVTAAVGIMSGGVRAQDAAASPGQQQEPASLNQAQNALSIGEIHWYPVDAACTFFTVERQGGFVEDQPDSWRFVFITMKETVDAGQPALEHGYVMTNGLLRELEKGKSAPDKDGNVVTVWRSAGEPRINVNMKLVETGAKDGKTGFQGQMTLFWGDKKATLDVAGTCRP